MTRHGPNAPNASPEPGPVAGLPGAALPNPEARLPDHVSPSGDWIGRMLDARGRPLDGRGMPQTGATPRMLRPALAPQPTERAHGAPFDTGIAAMDLFTPLCAGARMSLLARGDIGRARLFGMLGRFSDRDVIVSGLIGMADRDIRNLVQRELGPDGLARTVIVAAGEDDSPVMRRRAAWAALAAAEHFRDEGRRVLCLIDSVGAFAGACRELSLEAPAGAASPAYTPHVFDEVHRLISRAGPAANGEGDIAALFVVAETSGATDELLTAAIADMVDDRIVLDRRIAARGRYPAIDLIDRAHREAGEGGARRERLIAAAHAELSLWDNMAEFARLGVYTEGRNAEVDRALRCGPEIEELMKQSRRDRRDPALALDELEGCLS